MTKVSERHWKGFKKLTQLELEIWGAYIDYTYESPTQEFDRELAYIILGISAPDAVYIVSPEDVITMLEWDVHGCPHKNVVGECDHSRCLSSIERFQSFLEKNFESHPEWFEL